MELEQQLRVDLARCEPGPVALEAVMARLSVAPRNRSGSKRRAARYAVITGAVVLAAAAAMLAIHLAQIPDEPAVAATLHADGVVAAAESAAAEPAQSSAPAVAAAPIPASAVDEEAAPTFVLLLPLLYEAANPTAQARLREYHAAVLGELRTIPGVVVSTDPATSETAKPADFRLTVDGDNGNGTPPASGRWTGRLQIEARKDIVYTQPTPRLSAVSAEGALDPASCQTRSCTPVGMAESHVARLRSVLPRTAALHAHLQRMVLDTSLTQGQRKEALSQLSRMLKDGEQMDARVIRSAIELGSDSAPALARGIYWYMLRGQKHPELVQPLIHAVRNEPDDAARMNALLALTWNFGDDPAARSALESVASSDRKLLVRKVAERALAGDAPWREFVVASVKDTSLPLAQRFEPFSWMTEVSRTDDGHGMAATMESAGRAVLDQAGVEVLSDMIAEAKRAKGDVGFDSFQLASFLGSLRHPAVPELMLACFENTPRLASLDLLNEHRDDPRVRRKLEQVAAESPDEKLREAAAAMLAEAMPSPR